MKFAIARPPVPSLSIVGRSERFPVNRIFCVGRNYAAHAREMGGDERDPPFFFQKSASALVDASSPVSIAYPPKTADFHHEVELVVALGHGGFEINQDQASRLIYGYAVGLDMTRRDVQKALRDKGRPWELGKSFHQSAPIGAIAPAMTVENLESGTIFLDINGASRQRAALDNMIWSVAETIAFLSQYEPLQPGDLIMTGTPEGVGPVIAGDVLHGHVDGLPPIQVSIV